VNSFESYGERRAMIRHKRQTEYASSNADLVYGARTDGTIVHISEVPSGAVCGCRCPALAPEKSHTHLYGAQPKLARWSDVGRARRTK